MIYEERTVWIVKNWFFLIDRQKSEIPHDYSSGRSFHLFTCLFFNNSQDLLHSPFFFHSQAFIAPISLFSVYWHISVLFCCKLENDHDFDWSSPIRHFPALPRNFIHPVHLCAQMHKAISIPLATRSDLSSNHHFDVHLNSVLPWRQLQLTHGYDSHNLRDRVLSSMHHLGRDCCHLVWVEIHANVHHRNQVLGLEGLLGQRHSEFSASNPADHECLLAWSLLELINFPHSLCLVLWMWILNLPVGPSWGGPIQHLLHFSLLLFVFIIQNGSFIFAVIWKFHMRILYCFLFDGGLEFINKLWEWVALLESKGNRRRSFSPSSRTAHRLG